MSIKSLKYVYENTTDRAPLRKLLLDFVSCYSSPASSLENHMQHRWPRDALLDLARLVWKNKEELDYMNMTALDICHRYHVHHEVDFHCPGMGEAEERTLVAIRNESDEGRDEGVK
jgi:hypothetical protein